MLEPMQQLPQLIEQHVTAKYLMIRWPVLHVGNILADNPKHSDVCLAAHAIEDLQYSAPILRKHCRTRGVQNVQQQC